MNDHAELIKRLRDAAFQAEDDKTGKDTPESKLLRDAIAALEAGRSSGVPWPTIRARLELAIKHGDAHGWYTARNELLGVIGSDYAAAPQQPPPVGVTDGPPAMIARWRQPEPDNGEDETEFDKGCEQTFNECADELERWWLSHQQPPPVGVLTLLDESRANFKRQFGESTDADWVYADLRELLTRPPVGVTDALDRLCNDYANEVFPDAGEEVGRLMADVIEARNAMLRLSHQQPAPSVSEAYCSGCDNNRQVLANEADENDDTLIPCPTCLGFCGDTGPTCAERFAAPVSEPAASGESREDRMVTIERDEAGKVTVWCDPEIVDLVSALNAGGVRTIASCSGHGHRPGWIALLDGRHLTISPDEATHKRIEALFPVDINGDHIDDRRAASGEDWDALRNELTAMATKTDVQVRLSRVDSIIEKARRLTTTGQGEPNGWNIRRRDGGLLVTGPGNMTTFVNGSLEAGGMTGIVLHALAKDLLASKAQITTDRLPNLDFNLIANMLEAGGDERGIYTSAAIAEQVRLLREADNCHEAHTVQRSTGD